MKYIFLLTLYKKIVIPVIAMYFMYLGWTNLAWCATGSLTRTRIAMLWTWLTMTLVSADINLINHEFFLDYISLYF